MNRSAHGRKCSKFWAALAVVVLACLIGVAGQRSADAQEAAAVPKISSGRDLLSLYGLEPVKLMSFQDDQPVTPDELELVLRTLVVGRRFTLSELKRYALADVPWDKLSAAPDENRGELFHLRGRVKRADRLLLTPEQQEQYEVREAFRCELLVGEEQRRAMVFALRVPKAWKIGEPLDERVSAKAIFLKNAVTDEAADAPLFACTRLAWHPPGPLGDLGFDFGLLDDVENQTPLQLNDSEAFYSMLGVMGKVSGSELLRLAGANKPVESLFPTMRPEKGKMVRHDPRIQQGELAALSGMVIRCIEIKIESADLRAAYGMDHYYEIEMTNVDSQGNPISFCVRDIPPGMPVGRRLTTDVRIAGFFFKTWTFKQQRDATTLEQTAEGKVKLRVAPLLIGRAPILIEPLAKGNSWVNYTAAGVFLALAVGAWFGVWWFNREDRQFSARTIDKKFAPQPGKSLDDAGIEDHDPPDFSRLP